MLFPDIFFGMLELPAVQNIKGEVRNMRFLMIDIDTLRYDHLGCYGYNRNTSPNIDGIA